MSAGQRQRDWLAGTVSRLIWLALLAVVPPPVLAATTTAESTCRPAAKVSFVAEMEEVPELAVLPDGRRWSRQQQAAWSDDVAMARAAWRENAKALTGLLTVDRVHLSACDSRTWCGFSRSSSSRSGVCSANNDRTSSSGSQLLVRPYACSAASANADLRPPGATHGTSAGCGWLHGDMR